jgi:T4 RnlA family RNA ligase
MELHVQKFLRGGGTLQQLEEQWGIDATQSAKHPSLYLLKYNQIESPMAAPIVQECRGIILDSTDNWRVVAFPFTKFFNQGEQLAASIDWKTARVGEKLDGSLITMYWYDSEWNVATSGNPDAAGQVNGFDFTFSQMFWQAWFDLKPFTTASLNTNYTYIWEITSPYNRVVVPHKVTKVTLIGLRNAEDFREISPQCLAGCVPVVKEFDLNSLEDVLASMDHFDGLEREGYVVVDDCFNRIKIKHPRYVALHHMRDSSGPKAMLEIVRKNESDEFLVYFPEFAVEYNKIKLRYQMFCATLEANWYEVKDKAEAATLKICGPGAIIMPEYRKTFAGFAVQTKLPGYLFTRLDGKVHTAQEYLAKLPIDNLMKILELK